MYKIRIAAMATLPGPYPYRIVYQTTQGTIYEADYEVKTTSWHILDILYDSILRDPYMYNHLLVQRLLNYIFLNNKIDTVREPHPD